MLKSPEIFIGSGGGCISVASCHVTVPAAEAAQQHLQVKRGRLLGVSKAYLSLGGSSRCSIAVGVGFYGNSETNDGVYQLSYSLYNANHTLGGMDSLVSEKQSHVHVRYC